jgi:hypothetical protein
MKFFDTYEDQAFSYVLHSFWFVAAVNLCLVQIINQSSEFSFVLYYVASVFKQQAINNLKFASQISNQRGTEKIRFFLDFHETRVVWSVVRRVYKFVIDKPIASFAIRSHLTSLVIRHLQHMKVSSLSLNH